MGLRKFKCYRTVKRAYTRKSKFKKKNFIKAMPDLAIGKFEMGNLQKKFEYSVRLVSKVDHQIRQNALESARIMANKRLEEGLGATNYHFRINLYPHHALRENKMIVGAGADRMQSGMQQSFGRVIGIAAQAKKGKTVVEILTDAPGLEIVKSTIKSLTSRLPGTYYIEVSKKN